MECHRPPRTLAFWGFVLFVLLMLAAAPATAQKPPLEKPPSEKPLSEKPGYFPLEELDILSRKELSTEINLKKPLLKLVAAGTRKSEPAFSALVASLDAIRVWIAEPEDVELEKVRERIAGAAQWLEDHHWDVVVRTRDSDEEVYLYLREQDEEITGVAVLVVGSDGEVALINIVGAMDLSQLERLSEALDLPEFDLPDMKESDP